MKCFIQKKKHEITSNDLYQSVFTSIGLSSTSSQDSTIVRLTIRVKYILGFHFLQQECSCTCTWTSCIKVGVIISSQCLLLVVDYQQKHPFEKECTVFLFSKQFLSPLHPKIGIHILHTVLCTLILTGADKDWRFILTIKSFFS